jgi:ABC-2 type transport system permease protein
MSNPIADLSYRNYEGVLQPPTWRWWVIAKMVMKTAIKKKGFWTLAVLSAYWYVLLGVVFYFIDTLGSSSPGGHFLLNQTLSRIVWRDQFLNGFALSQLFLFIIALLIGVGTISNDNRAHALLVYLSKPCTKIDYLAGKWVGIFLVIAAVSAVPTAIFFAYCGLSFSQYGFFSNEPLLWAKLIGIVMLPAAFHASVCLGISSLINQSRLAGAGYAGLYFMSGVFAPLTRRRLAAPIQACRRMLCIWWAFSPIVR